MEFLKYQHIERFGRPEVEGIENGMCYIFPKIDGTSASIWTDGKQYRAGSRNREISSEKDNQGFFNEFLCSPQCEPIKKCFDDHPNLRFYGEWLVPHSLKTYRDDAWRKFYVYDVIEHDGENWRYLSYPEYSKLCEEYGIEYIPCYKIIFNPSYSDLTRLLYDNGYLIKNGEGFGEGIVIKNYEFTNRYGRTTWAKIVTSEFKEKHAKICGPSVQECQPVEKQIVDKLLTNTMIEKTYCKINGDNENIRTVIPRLLETVFHDFVNEETYQICKDFKYPKVDFKKLKVFVIKKIKETKKELF